MERSTTKKQEALIKLLEGGAPESPELPFSSVASAHVQTLGFGPTIDPCLAGLAVKDLQNRDHLDFVSNCPPSQSDIQSFSRGMKRRTKVNRQKLRFGRTFWMILNDPDDLKLARQRVKYSRFYPEYFYSETDFSTHKQRTHQQAIACQYRAALRGE